MKDKYTEDVSIEECLSLISEMKLESPKLLDWFYNYMALALEVDKAKNGPTKSYTIEELILALSVNKNPDTNLE